MIWRVVEDYTKYILIGRKEGIIFVNSIATEKGNSEEQTMTIFQNSIYNPFCQMK